MNLTVPDSNAIDALRGVVVVLGVVFLFGLILARFRHNDLPVRARSAIYALALLGLPSVATEVQQLGKPMLVWRLPLTIVAVGYGLWWVIRVGAPPDE